MTADIIITIVLSLLSILMILMEIFLLPGITIAGVAGAIFSVGSIYYAYTNLGAIGGHLTVAVSVALFGFLFVWLIRSNAMDRISLTTNMDANVDTSNMDDIGIGDEGVSISRLNPMGKVRINNISVEAKSMSGFIDDGVTIVVLKKFANQVVVGEKADQ